MNVQDIRDYPRLMLDLELDDLPDTLVDRWMAEGFQRIVRRAQKWPHLEVTDTVVTAANDATYNLSTVARVRAIHGPRGELRWMDEAEARQRYWNVSTPVPPSWPEAWSEWGGGIVLWPTPNAAYTLTVLGYREPKTDWVGVTGAAPDLPTKFHEILLSWVMYRTYQQQDDIENAQMEKASFDEGLAELTGDDLAMPPSTAGLVLGGDKRRSPSWNSRLPYNDGWE